MKRETARKTSYWALFAVAVVVAVVAGYVGGYADARNAYQVNAATHSKPANVGANAAVITRDGFMPVYFQTDPQWSGIDYAAGNIGSDGCGLVCAAMACEYLTGTHIDPVKMVRKVGNSCLTYGENDPAKFCEWIINNYPSAKIKTDGIYYDSEKAIQDVQAGKLVFASATGRVGADPIEYAGHIVLLWRYDDSGIWVRDPYSPVNTGEPMTLEEFNGVNWVYFHALYREGARNREA